MRSDYHTGTTWGRKGSTPIVKSTGTRFRFNLISAINSLGQMRFMLTDQNVNNEVYVEFLRRLLVGATQPVFLVVDGHSVHRSRAVKQFVISTEGKLHAGTTTANTAATLSSTATVASVAGSVGLKPNNTNNKFLIHPSASGVASNPIPTPNTTGFIPSLSINVKMSLRLAPNAIRNPSSRVCIFAVYDAKPQTPARASKPASKPSGSLPPSAGRQP